MELIMKRRTKTVKGQGDERVPLKEKLVKRRFPILRIKPSL